LEPSRHDRRRVVLRRNGFVCSDGFSNNVAGVEKMKKKSGCGGSVKWEQPDNYKNPEISAFDLMDKEQRHTELRKKARSMR
jgi:hypothetical protein